MTCAVLYIDAETAAEGDRCARHACLGFCVGVEHPVHGAPLQRACIPSLASVGETERRARRRLRKLSSGVNCLFAVDLFNEGVDVPESTRSSPCADREFHDLPSAARAGSAGRAQDCLTVHRLHRHATATSLRSPYRALNGASAPRLSTRSERAFPSFGVARSSSICCATDRPGNLKQAIARGCHALE